MELGADKHCQTQTTDSGELDILTDLLYVSRCYFMIQIKEQGMMVIFCCSIPDTCQR